MRWVGGGWVGGDSNFKGSWIQVQWAQPLGSGLCSQCSGFILCFLHTGSDIVTGAPSSHDHGFVIPEENLFPSTALYNSPWRTLIHIGSPANLWRPHVARKLYRPHRALWWEWSQRFFQKMPGGGQRQHQLHYNYLLQLEFVKGSSEIYFTSISYFFKRGVGSNEEQKCSWWACTFWPSWRKLLLFLLACLEATGLFGVGEAEEQYFPRMSIQSSAAL